MTSTTSHTILFIGSNPSRSSSSTIPFWEDSKSRKIIDNWLSKIALDHPHSILFANVSNDLTENNRPLKMREIRLNAPLLLSLIQKEQPTKIVALGKTAEQALTLLHLNFYHMPHPSGLNRQLNNQDFVKEKIKGLQDYLNKP